VTAIPSPPHIGDYISAATLTPYDGSPIIAISANMPQFHTKSNDIIYTGILTWIHTKIISKFPMVTPLMGGDLQATPTEEDERSYHAPLNQFCKESGLAHITPSYIHTYIPVKNFHRPLVNETTTYNRTQHEDKHKDFHPHPGIRRP
jgi:hypothetical protein